MIAQKLRILREREKKRGDPFYIKILDPESRSLSP